LILWDAFLHCSPHNLLRKTQPITPNTRAVKSVMPIPTEKTESLFPAPGWDVSALADASDVSDIDSEVVEDPVSAALVSLVVESSDMVVETLSEDVWLADPLPLPPSVTR